jgi:Predicted membrane protein (DUF2231)
LVIRQGGKICSASKSCVAIFQPTVDGEYWWAPHPPHAGTLSDCLFRRRFRDRSGLLALDVFHLGDLFGLVAHRGPHHGCHRCDRGADFAADRRVREFRPAWYQLLGNALVIVLSVINVFVHSRDGYAAVVPTGLILSGLVVLILMATAWMGREMVYRDRVGVAG